MLSTTPRGQISDQKCLYAPIIPQSVPGPGGWGFQLTSALIYNRAFISFVPRPLLLCVSSRANSNMADNGSFSPCLRLYISQLIRVNRTRRLVMQVALHCVLSRRRLFLGVSLVLLLLLYARNITRVPRSRLLSWRRLSRNTEHFMQNERAHFKLVYLVGEKEIELHIASDSAIFFFS